MQQELQVFEREGISTCDSPPPQDTPQESWQYLPLSESADQQDFAQRLALLRHELAQIEAEMTVESKELASQDLDYVSELVTIAKQTEQANDDPEFSVSLQGKVSREITQSLLNRLDSPFTFQVCGTKHQQAEATENNLTASLIAVSARLAKLEESLGSWKAANSYERIGETLTSLRLHISQLDGKGIDALNSRVDVVTGNFNNVTRNLSMMQSAAIEQNTIDEMFDALELVEQVGPLLPQILLRLETIERICNEGSRFNYRMQEIQRRQRKIEEKIKTQHTPALVSQWNKFKADIQTKFKELEKKLKR